MRLRKLELTDAPLMLEWMHDRNVVEFMKADFSSKTLDDCKEFIINSQNDNENIHFAIEENGEYQGTVSLKNLSAECGEFAITVRKSAMGTGLSAAAMREIIRIGFEDLNLSFIYWYVDPANARAVHFYDKNGFARTDEFASADEDKEYIWYKVNGKH